MMERTRASVITKNSSRGIWSSWPINKDVDENRWPEEYSAKLGVIRMTSVHQGGFSVDSIQYSAEGGKGEAERWVHTSRTLIPLGPVIVGHISWSTMPGNSVGNHSFLPFYHSSTQPALKRPPPIWRRGPQPALSAGAHLPVSRFSLGALLHRTAAGLPPVPCVIREVLGSFSLCATGSAHPWGGGGSLLAAAPSAA